MEGKGQARARRKGQGRVLSYGVRAEGMGERTRNTAGAWREGTRDEGAEEGRDREGQGSSKASTIVAIGRRRVIGPGRAR